MAQEADVKRFKLPEGMGEKAVKIIDDSIKQNREKRGLIIEEKDINFEVFFFLCTLEHWADIDRTKRLFGLKEAKKDLDDGMKTYFGPFNLEVNIKNRKQQEENQKKYFSHLEEIKTPIVDLFFGITR